MHGWLALFEHRHPGVPAASLCLLLDVCATLFRDLRYLRYLQYLQYLQYLLNWLPELIRTV